MYINLPFKLYFLHSSNHEVLPNQIYLDLHDKNEVGCIVNQNHCSLTSAIYYHSTLILNNVRTNSDDDISVFIPAQFTLDTVFSIYIINRLIESPDDPQNDIHDKLNQLLCNEKKGSIYNLHSIFLAANQTKNLELIVIKLLTLIDLILSKADIDLSDDFIESVIVEQPFLKQEIDFLNKDYQTFDNETKNTQITKYDTFQVLNDNGNLITITGQIQLVTPNAILNEHWLKHKGIAILITYDQQNLLLTK